ncbi:pentatricopeptide repeat-containing protein At2g03880, mitochondrial [Cryptomeria japonica]|uniref:pentatricopeptide repeat-containing protein At2g03880, mitochondrial n=1 Tax=Cryptomeria japonica TaxID=3369 RepID=UPI0027D9FD28|nr:pentatricopeptide repeat-containing protein At2g03880, mitochondrial [Cryptomeria japonica]
MNIHQSITEGGFLLDAVVGSALADMYAKCGNIDKALELFDSMSQKDVISWISMIAGYVQNRFGEKALETFKQLQLAGVKPDSSTFASILPVCAQIGALELGVKTNATTFSGILPACAKLGALEQGYVQNGFYKDALNFFELMKDSGTSPDIVSFACVLFACSHASLVDEGCTYFNCMSLNGIKPTVDHYVCMVDLLARVGYLEDTLNFIIKMPVKHEVVVWMCFLGACRSHKIIGLGVFTSTLLLDFDPKNAATYVLLSNIYAEVGRWGEVQMVRKLMKDRGIIKIPGCSWIADHKTVHAFCVGDRSHPHTEKIYKKLKELAYEMKAAGYLPDSRHSLNNVEEEEKELFLCHHSEKLAIAFGLLNTPPEKTIRVVKNLRVCTDCHTAKQNLSPKSLEEKLL